MWLLLACSFLSVGIFAERFFLFHRATINVGDFLQGLANLIGKKNYAEALHECAGTPGPVARVIHAAVIRHESPREQLRDIVQEAGQLEVPRLEHKSINRWTGVCSSSAEWRHNAKMRSLRLLGKRVAKFA